MLQATYFYCPTCKSNRIDTIVGNQAPLYFCLGCEQQIDKPFRTDGRIKILNTNRGIKHISVAGVIIHDGKVLLAKRSTPPFGLELPVGHLEVHETLEQALAREIQEEVGLEVKGATLLKQIEHPVSLCRYGSHVEEWAVFLVDTTGIERVTCSEFNQISWWPINKIPTKKLTPQTHFVLTNLILEPYL